MKAKSIHNANRTHKTDGKISIRHFLNTKLKPEIGADGIKRYPLYVRFIVKQKGNTIKSKLNEYVSFEGFESFQNEKANELWKEREVLRRAIETLTPWQKENFDIKWVNANYDKLHKPLHQVIDACIKNELKIFIDEQGYGKREKPIKEPKDRIERLWSALSNAVVKSLNWEDFTAIRIASNLEFLEPKWKEYLLSNFSIELLLFETRDPYSTLIELNLGICQDELRLTLGNRFDAILSEIDMLFKKYDVLK